MKNTFFRNISNLFKVKTLVTLLVMSVFSWLAVKGDMDSQNVMYIATSVISFYFGTQIER